jgi:hypothetical protein
LTEAALNDSVTEPSRGLARREVGIFIKLRVLKSRLMKTLLIGLCTLGLSAGLISKTVAQTVTIELSPATNDSYWVWNDEYQCWLWNGPEFQGDYQGHPYSYWHGRHQGGGDRNNRPVKGDAEPSKVEQPATVVEKAKAEQPKVEERPKVEEKGKVEEKSKTEEKPKAEKKSKTEPPKTEDKKDH